MVEAAVTGVGAVVATGVGAVLAIGVGDTHIHGTIHTIHTILTHIRMLIRVVAGQEVIGHKVPKQGKGTGSVDTMYLAIEPGFEMKTNQGMRAISEVKPNMEFTLKG